MKQRCGNCVFFERAWVDDNDHGYCDWYTHMPLPVRWKKLTGLVKTTAQSGRTCKCFVEKRKK